MQDKVPFDAYDFFAYLASGALVLASLSIAFPDAFGFAETAVARAAFGVVAAYVLGHVVAQVSSTILELGIVRTLLSHPVEVLLERTRPGKWRVLFREFARPLPASAVKTATTRLAKEGVGASDTESIIALATQLAFREAPIAVRMDKFLRLYGFARNATVACALAALLLLVPARSSSDVQLGVVAALASYALWLRYLKFYRLYFHEALLQLRN